jgi:hypothetical protein
MNLTVPVTKPEVMEIGGSAVAVGSAHNPLDLPFWHRDDPLPGTSARLST